MKLLLTILLLIQFQINDKSYQFHQLIHEFKNRKESLQIDTFPNFALSEKISTNAVYANDTIFLSKAIVQNCAFAEEDKISIIYHEWNHFKCDLENKFQYRKTVNGEIYQIPTNKLIKKDFCKAEFILDSLSLIKPGMAENEKNLLLSSIKKASYVKFIYAPSNLSREEIYCYSKEMEAGKSGALKLSKMYFERLICRIKYEEKLLKLRRKFEAEHLLSETGNRK